ncbi:MAG TPA: hypothetical protein DHM42_09120 [Clostridiales bacterium]|nr:hypothetical protein [Clostridiales bacterium]
MKSIYESNLKDWQKILKNLDYTNEEDFETFESKINDFFYDVEKDLFDDLCDYLESDLAVYSDAELRELTEEEIEGILEFISK